MQENQNNNQHGINANVDTKQRQEGINKVGLESSKKSSNINDSMEDETKRKNNDSTTRKEHDDTNHDHDYKTPTDQKGN